MQQTTIDLGAGVQASAVVAAPGAGAAEVLHALALPPHQAVLLLLGAADGLDAALPASASFLAGALRGRPSTPRLSFWMVARMPA